jgi:hypothetical protein
VVTSHYVELTSPSCEQIEKTTQTRVLRVSGRHPRVEERDLRRDEHPVGERVNLRHDNRLGEYVDAVRVDKVISSSARSI